MVVVVGAVVVVVVDVAVVVVVGAVVVVVGAVVVVVGAVVVVVGAVVVVVGAVVVVVGAVVVVVVDVGAVVGVGASGVRTGPEAALGPRFGAATAGARPVGDLSSDGGRATEARLGKEGELLGTGAWRRRDEASRNGVMTPTGAGLGRAGGATTTLGTRPVATGGAGGWATGSGAGGGAALGAGGAGAVGGETTSIRGLPDP